MRACERGVLPKGLVERMTDESQHPCTPTTWSQCSRARGAPLNGHRGVCVGVHQQVKCARVMQKRQEGHAGRDLRCTSVTSGAVQTQKAGGGYKQAEHWCSPGRACRMIACISEVISLSGFSAGALHAGRQLLSCLLVGRLHLQQRSPNATMA